MDFEVDEEALGLFFREEGAEVGQGDYVDGDFLAADAAACVFPGELGG